MSAPDPVKEAWQASVTEPSLPPLDQLSAGADLFYRKIRRRNFIEYAACVLVVIVFTFYVFKVPLLTARIGAALIVAATFFIAWQLHRRASALPLPEAAGASSILAFQRAQLARQRDALKNILSWYILPMLPGLLLMMFAPAIEFGPAILLKAPWNAWLGMAGVLVVFGSIWWLNQRAARKLQRAIDGIDALTGGKE